VKKTTINYWVDVVIAIALGASAVSGLAFLLPTRSPTVLGVSMLLWDRIHVFSSLAMMAGVLGHLVMHREWIACTTRKQLGIAKPAARPALRPSTAAVTRRGFLRYGSIALLVFGGPAVLLRSLANAAAATANGATPVEAAPAAGEPTVAVDATAPTIAAVDGPEHTPTQPAATAVGPTPTGLQIAAPATMAAPDATVAPTPSPEGAVACRRGITYDPYPGRCRLYIDRDGDGFCDYSIPQG